jgi:hypothetical protein
LRTYGRSKADGVAAAQLQIHLGEFHGQGDMANPSESDRNQVAVQGSSHMPPYAASLNHLVHRSAATLRDHGRDTVTLFPICAFWDLAFNNKIKNYSYRIAYIAIMTLEEAKLYLAPCDDTGLALQVVGHPELMVLLAPDPSKTLRDKVFVLHGQMQRHLDGPKVTVQLFVNYQVLLEGTDHRYREFVATGMDVNPYLEK